MNDIATDPSANGSATLLQTLADLERRVQILETKVAALPDAQQMEERVAEKVKAGLPPRVDPAQSPGFRDIEMPIPSAQSIMNTAKATWLLFEMFGELRMMFWALFDRRYHAGWITRGLTILFVAYILTSHWWAADNSFSRVWDKLIDVLLAMILFMILTFETRRYKQWRSQR